MVTVDTEWRTSDEVTLIRARIKNTQTTTQVVRLESPISGPVWSPPDQEPAVSSEAENAWDVLVKPGRCRGIGFATPLSITDEDTVLDVVSVSRATAEQLATTPDDVLADLPDWSPTSTVIPTGQ